MPRSCVRASDGRCHERRRTSRVPSSSSEPRPKAPEGSKRSKERSLRAAVDASCGVGVDSSRFQRDLIEWSPETQQFKTKVEAARHKQMYGRGSAAPLRDSSPPSLLRKSGFFVQSRCAVRSAGDPSFDRPLPAVYSLLFSSSCRVVESLSFLKKASSAGRRGRFIHRGRRSPEAFGPGRVLASQSR